MKKKESPIYRPMLWRALQTAWSHRELWVFALFAGLASTGVVVNDLLQQAEISMNPGNTLAQALGGDIGAFIHAYASIVLSSGTSHILVATLGVCGVIISVSFLIVLCQQILLVAMHRAVHKKSQLTGRELLKTLHHHHFLRILGVDLLFHVAIFIVLGGGGTILRELPSTMAGGGFITVLLAAATLFIAFVLNVIAMLTLIAVGQEHVAILNGIQEGIERFMRHPLVCCEVALLVFAANLGLTIAFFFGLTTLALPIGFLFAEALSQGALGLLLGVTFVGTLIALFFTVAMAGFMTTFTYGVWTLLAEYLDRAPFGSRFHHHVRKHYIKHIHVR